MDRGKELKNLSTGETFVDTLHQKVTPAVSTPVSELCSIPQLKLEFIQPNFNQTM